MKRTPRVGSTPKRVPPAASSSRVDTEKHDEPLVGKRKGMGKTWNMKRKLYLPQTRDQPDMRAMRVAKAATRGRPGGWGRGVASAPASRCGDSRDNMRQKSTTTGAGTTTKENAEMQP